MVVESCVFLCINIFQNEFYTWAIFKSWQKFAMWTVHLHIKFYKSRVLPKKNSLYYRFLSMAISESKMSSLDRIL